MGIADIQQKQNEERKREKRLVHLTNELSRDFLNAASAKSKTATMKNDAEFLVKSFLDYIFFHDHKEIREINEQHIQHFMLEYAPRKMSIAPEIIKEIPGIFTEFLIYLDQQNHINNGNHLIAAVNANSKDCIQAFQAAKKITSTKSKTKEPAKTKKAQKKLGAEQKVGRNDPCPCGSGKKYKKCCGK